MNMILNIILGARMTAYGITYLVGWADIGFEPTTYSANDAHEKFPKLVTQFLENNIEFGKPGNTQDNHSIVISAEPIGNLIEIICKLQEFLPLFFFSYF